MIIKTYNTMRVALCCIGKLENLYIREFVEHYKTIGFDKIFLYDNNDINGEHFELVIGDFIDNGFVDLIDYRGRKMCQLAAYQECYDNKNSEYDWFFFCDCDEYLTLNDTDNIKKYLEDERFSDYGCIFINWRLMNDGDKNLCYYDGRPLAERFVHFNEDDGVNMHTKSIVRCGLSNIVFDNGTHSPRKECDTCDCEGNKVDDPNYILYGPNYSRAYIKHYIVKTPCEYLFIKRSRGNADLSDDESIQRLTEDFYFAFSRKTEEKINVFKKYLHQ